MKPRFLPEIVAAFCFLLLAGTAAFAVDAEDKYLALAHEARERAPWEMPDDVFRNYVAPQTSVGEAEDDWRPLFREKFLPLVEGCATPTEAAEKLNREIWEILGVRYSPERDRPDQSPFHSMRIGKASCTGLSILLINACRSVGVPARFVGCRWKNKPGNHSWVEIWDDGEWKHIGAGDGGVAGETWFDYDAAQADPDDPQYAIYAACVDPTGLFFPLPWQKQSRPLLSGIPAVNVTRRYLDAAEKLPPGTARVSFDLRSRDGVRTAREIIVFDAATGKELARGNTHDDRFDLNDHLRFAFPQGAKLRVAAADAPEKSLAEITVPAKDATFRVVAP